MSPKTRTLLLIGAAALLIVAPLLLPGLEGEFKGADQMALDVIRQMRPDYEPWFEPVWTPPSGEVESMLFAMQAALGAGVVGYMIGRRRARADDDAAAR